MSITPAITLSNSNKLNSIYLLLIAGILTATSAQAIVDDTPYFDLYPGAATSVELCGVSGCDSSLNMIVEVANIIPAGSGVRDTFLRLQNDNGNVLTETAYSTNGTLSDPTFLQDDSATGGYVNGAKDSTAGNNDDFNNAILLTDLDVKTISGKTYYQIVLDVNEPGGNKSLIRLDEFEIHMSMDGFLSEYEYVETVAGDSFFSDGLCSGPCLADGSNYLGLVYDMDFERSNPDPQGEDVGGLILDSLAGGNGSGDEDYSFFLPTALFDDATTAGGMYLHLVSTFGEANSPDADPAVDGFAQSGFEEWAAEMIINPTGSVPDVPAPGTAFLIAIGALGFLGRRKQTWL